MLYVAALLRRVFYFQFPKRRNAVNASEVNILLRVSKLSCAARRAKVPFETTLNYDATRPGDTGLSQWRIRVFFLVAARTPPPPPIFFAGVKGTGQYPFEKKLPTSRGYATAVVCLILKKHAIIIIQTFYPVFGHHGLVLSPKLSIYTVILDLHN